MAVYYKNSKYMLKQVPVSYSIASSDEFDFWFCFFFVHFEHKILFTIRTQNTCQKQVPVSLYSIASSDEFDFWFCFFFFHFEHKILFDLNFCYSVNWYVSLFEKSWLIACYKTQLISFFSPRSFGGNKK